MAFIYLLVCCSRKSSPHCSLIERRTTSCILDTKYIIRTLSDCHFVGCHTVHDCRYTNPVSSILSKTTFYCYISINVYDTILFIDRLFPCTYGNIFSKVLQPCKGFLASQMSVSGFLMVSPAKSGIPISYLGIVLSPLGFEYLENISDTVYITLQYVCNFFQRIECSRSTINKVVYSVVHVCYSGIRSKCICKMRLINLLSCIGCKSIPHGGLVKITA